MTATLAAPPRTKNDTTTVTLTIARSALRTALTRLSGAVGSGVKSLPVTQHVRLEVKPGSVTFTATDFETWARLTASCEATGNAVVLLPAKRLSEIVANLPPVGAVALELSERKGVLSAGRSVFEIGGLALYEWPEDLSVESGGRVTVNAAAFLDALGRVVPFASTAESRANINVVRIIPAVDVLHLSAFEGHCLARLAVASAGGLFPVACSLHRLSVAVLARLFGGLPDDATLSLGLEETRLLVESGDATAIVRLVDKDFPEYDKAIASLAPTRTVLCDRLLLSAAIRRVALVTNDARRIEITVADEIIVRAAGEGLSTGSDVVPIETDSDGVPVTIALNASMALAALDTIAADSVAIAIESPTRPVVFRPASAPADSPALVLVQPLRIL
jgi:DNA polymerase-3 subunit beta